MIWSLLGTVAKGAVDVMKTKTETKKLLAKAEQTHAIKMAEGKIIKADPKKGQIEVKSIHTNYNLRPYRLHIAIAPTKSNSRSCLRNGRGDIFNNSYSSCIHTISGCFYDRKCIITRSNDINQGLICGALKLAIHRGPLIGYTGSGRRTAAIQHH